jgi:hypothetical protein
VVTINTGNERNTKYASKFEGNGVVCFENSWVAGTLTNPLLGYREPDVIILISMNNKDRPYILWEMKRVQCPVINLSGENYGPGFIETAAGQQLGVIHFYVELFLCLINRFQQKRGRLPSARAIYKRTTASQAMRPFFRRIRQYAREDLQGNNLV